MKIKTFSMVIVALMITSMTTSHAADKKYVVQSPNGKTEASIDVEGKVTYTISQDQVEVLAPSAVAMTLTDGTVWGVNSKVKNTSRKSVNQTIETPFYKDSELTDSYNELSINFTDGWSLQFRAYDDGVAYRFTSSKSGEYQIESEKAEFTFTEDAMATVPYVSRSGSIESQLIQSFENTYTNAKLSELDKNRLMFLPLTVEAPMGKRVTITESDLRDYPGMYLTSSLGNNSLSGYYAEARDEIEEHSGHNNLQVGILSRHDYIAEVDGARTFPWRVAIVTGDDVALANSSIVYKLAEPNVIGDTSWIKPGKVAWEWWNNWNLEGVDFVAGINNDTYKYYIDFAGKNGIEYVILDEGWAVNKAYDLMQVVPEIDIPELIAYGEERGVGIILWAGYYAFDVDMENVCKHYSAMGVKGFKVDFMNGDDQELVNFNERVAKMCAKYELLVDLHGTYKPTGLQRTYPNILNFEGVHGLEQMKWQPATCDQVTYDVTIPYLRLVAGPADYTQGAMRNAVRILKPLDGVYESQYHPVFSKPMSQGTRCHQLAQYIVFFSPLNMLCDTPTNYEKEPVSTDFIASIPTVWDESKTIQGTMGEYIVTARRSGDKWYIGGLNNWDARDITINIKDITGKDGKATLYQDGKNATHNGEDFKKITIETSGDTTVHMAPGGGFAIVID